MARSLSERLRALQASVGGPGSTPDSGSDGTSSDRVGSLDAPRSIPSSEEVEQPVCQSKFESECRAEHEFAEEGYSEIGKGVWHRTLRYDILVAHGDHRFADLCEADLGGLLKAAKLSDLVQLQAQDLRFYDTETTGLGTGAGTFPFLHAVGRFEEDEFVVHQYFLADYAAECELLTVMIHDHFSDGVTVVTFNGKSFDWPLLSNRLTMHRLEAPVVFQLDLLYPSRRLWRQTLTRVSLGAVESAILGLERLDDLPGKEAPMRYFEYVSDGILSRLVPVFDHNATDVCSLVTLAGHLADILSGRTSVHAASEWSALGRLYDEWNESDLALRCFHQAVDCPDASWREHWLHSLHCKRRGDVDTAVETWLRMADHYPWSVPPCVELAKVYEHRIGDFQAALMFAREAKNRMLRYSRDAGVEGNGTPRYNGGADERIVSALQHRMARIERKLSAHSAS